ncbi:hypothetical protein BDV96DRAFT_566445 [Lophiotrema nucula]|uniref:RNase H type-1 domain-containing protein n=1 Tax=Lophiotrema nucula TaxID=690887 RepID=A0A6A5ZLT8_9PLEO|nr:hypothetical protein BDV96DRAFT_566445 [Lophiotrema nucula]
MSMRRSLQHEYRRVPLPPPCLKAPFFYSTRSFRTNPILPKRKARKPSDFLPTTSTTSHDATSTEEDAQRRAAQKVAQAVVVVNKRIEQKEQTMLRRALLLEHSLRKARIWSQIVGIPRAKAFPGTIHLKTCPGSALLVDGQTNRDTLVFYADGSHNRLDGYLGAGVAWEEQTGMQSLQYGLGRYTGTAADAEVYAISAALELAVKRVGPQKGSGKVRVVRVLTDSREALRDLTTCTASSLGPMIDGKYAVQGIFQSTEQLAQQGVRVHLVWVKGHGDVAGNIAAHRAAFQAVTVQARQPVRTITLPKAVKDAGPDYIQEWLFNASEPWFSSGKGECHVRIEQKYEDIEYKCITPPKIAFKRPVRESVGSRTQQLKIQRPKARKQLMMKAQDMQKDTYDRNEEINNKTPSRVDSVKEPCSRSGWTSCRQECGYSAAR